MHTMAKGGGLVYKLGSAITHLRLPPVLHEEGEKEDHRINSKANR